MGGVCSATVDVEVVVTLVDGRVDVEVVAGALEYAASGVIFGRYVVVVVVIVAVTPDGKVAVDISEGSSVDVWRLETNDKDFTVTFGCCEGKEVGMVAWTVGAAALVESKISTFTSSCVLKSS